MADINIILSIASGITANVAVGTGGGGGGSGLDEKVKYDSGDTTADYLSDKIVAGTGISLSEGIGEDANKLKITGTGSYSLPIATDTILGGVKEGSRITIDANGVISADVQTTDISGKVDKVTGSSLLADTEASKIHTSGTDQGLDTGGTNAVTAAQAKAGYTHSGTAHAPSDAISLATVKGDADISDAISKKHALNADNETLSTVGALLTSASVDTPLDADTFTFWDVVDALLKKVSWATIKGVFALVGHAHAGVYQPVGSYLVAADITGKVNTPANNTADYIPQWNGTDSKTLQNGLAVPAGGLAGLTALGDKLNIDSDEIEFTLINSFLR